MAIFSAHIVTHAADWFVSPNGRDANTGTREKPFATLERARAVARVADPRQPKTVWLRGGNLMLLQTLELTAADSGLTIRSVDGENVTLSGGRALSANNFQPVKDAATLARIAPAVRGKIVELDLAALRLTHHASPALPRHLHRQRQPRGTVFQWRTDAARALSERRLHGHEARPVQRWRHH